MADLDIVAALAVDIMAAVGQVVDTTADPVGSLMAVAGRAANLMVAAGLAAVDSLMVVADRVAAASRVAVMVAATITVTKL